MKKHARRTMLALACVLCAAAAQGASARQGGGTSAAKPANASPGAAAKPCADSPAHRQLDFWLGEWDVQVPQGHRVGSNTLQLILDGCVILESYTQPDGYSGKSLSFYDSNLGKWRQTWVDHRGGVSDFVGEYRDGAMRFEGETHTPDGKSVLRRMTVSDLGGGRVRQLSERSADGGKTWGVTYDFIYIRKKSSQ